MDVEILADVINEDCETPKTLWLACGVIKETLKVWENPVSYSRLCDVAQNMVDRYTE